MVGGGENGASTSQIGSGDGSGDGDAEGLVELPPRMTPGSTQLAAHGRCAHEARPFNTAAGLGCAMHQLYAVTHAGMQAGGGPGGDGGDGGGEDAAGGGGGCGLYGDWTAHCPGAESQAGLAGCAVQLAVTGFFNPYVSNW